MKTKKEDRAYIDRIIRKYYPTGGPQKCMEFIHNKTKQQISRRANYLGIAIIHEHSGRNKDKISIWEKEGWDDIIREKYPTGGSAACLPFIPSTLVKISSRAHTIGVSMNEEDKKRIRGQASAIAKAKLKHEAAKELDENIKYDPFISGPVPLSIFNRRLECEYYLQ